MTIRKTLLASAAILALPLLASSPAMALAHAGAPGALPAAHAGAAGVTPATNGPFALCDDGTNTYYCITDNKGSSTGGTHLLVEPEQSPRVPAQVIYWSYDTSACGGGAVTATCPFTDHTWDQRYLNSTILTLSFPDIAGNNCVGADTSSDQDAILSSCSGAGSRVEWVDAFDAYIVDGSVLDGYALYNVYWSNEDQSSGNLQALSGSNTKQGNATVTNWVDGALQSWIFR
jgi:hypothetical protein